MNSSPSEDQNWCAQVDRIYQEARASSPQTLQHLFPSSFINVVLPKIGGHLVIADEDERLPWVGFLFPRGLNRGKKEYTLWLHMSDHVQGQERTAAVREWLFHHPIPFDIHIFDPLGKYHVQETHHLIGEFDIGRPSAAEAAEIRHLQQAIWQNTPLDLYPAAMHAVEFGLGTSLVARYGGRIVGFLFGFYRFDTSKSNHQTTVTIESQLLGVEPPFRSRRVGFLLKQRQAALALSESITRISWTADPLQWVNGMFNFGKLRATANSFYAHYYPFRNALNRLPASRLMVTWQLDSAQVQAVLAGTTQTVIASLDDLPNVQIVNRGSVEQPYDVEAATRAIEIPQDWNRLQWESLEEACQWRETTDRVLQQSIGRSERAYVITDVAKEGERCYLIAQRNDVL